MLPTGGGKSLCYQLPALAMDGLCLVVSPLIALMEDQVKGLTEKGISAVAMTAGSSWKTNQRKLQAALRTDLKLLYVSPERLQTRLFQEFLPQLPLSLIAIDEAHCVSQWGHDFRPEYLKIAELRYAHPSIPVLALTASATKDVQDDIRQYLNLKKTAVFQQSLRRENLLYEVRYAENKISAVEECIDKDSLGSSIIYCGSRRHTEDLARHLSNHNIDVNAYHAGMSRDKRTEAQDKWMKAQNGAMVATTAFGMGIDKATVRQVVHYDPPLDLESFYQETGRAGRDGMPAKVTTFYQAADFKKMHEQIALKYPPEAYLKQVYQAVCDYLQVPTGNEPQQYFPFELSEFCKNFGLKPTAAIHALKLLAQEGLWTLTESFYHPSTICFLVERDVLDDVSNRYPVLANVILAMLRLYSGILFHPAKIMLLTIARQAKIQVAEAEALIKHLHGMGVLEYEQAGEGPQLFFHHRRVEAAHLFLNLERLRKLKNSYEFRTLALIAFLQNNSICRVKMLLDYFQESGPKYCGHCDVCLKENLKAASGKQIKQAVLLEIRNRSLSLKEISHQLRHLREEELQNALREMMDDRILAQDLNGRLYCC